MNAIRRIWMIDPMELVAPLVIFAVTVAIGYLLRRVFLRALGAWNERTRSQAGAIFAESVRGPALIWVVILAAHLALESSHLPAWVTGWSGRILLALWVLSITLACMRVAGEMVRHYGGQIPGALPVTTLTQNLAKLAVLILGIVLMLRSLGAEITPILTALGVGGLAVALALQDTLSNLFGGFYVAVAGQVRLGDYIRLNTGEEGYVADIGWRCTTFRALASNLVIVPNAKLAQAIVTNFYLPDKRVGMSLQVGVGYDCDPEHVERVLLEVGTRGSQEIEGLVAEPAPSVVLDPGFGDSAMAFTLNYTVAEFASQFRVRHELRKRIFRRFREEGIDIPFPSRTVYLRPPAPPDAAQPGL